MKRSIPDKIRAAVEEWARIHNVVIVVNEASYSGIGNNIHVLVVASKGFENWSDYDRLSSLFDFLHENVNTNNDFSISRLWLMTEEEYEKYEGMEA